MKVIPINWHFRRKGIIPIVEARGISNNVDTKGLLLKNAIVIIDKAAEFKGIIISDKPDSQTTDAISVSFSLMFPSEMEITEFMEFLQKNM